MNSNKEYFTVGRAWYIAVTVLHFVSQSSQARRTLAVSWNKVGSNKWIMQNLFKKIYISLSEYLLVVRKQLNSKPHQHLFVLWKTLETIMAIIINLQQAFRRKFIRGERYLAGYLLWWYSLTRVIWTRSYIAELCFYFCGGYTRHRK